MTSSRPLKQVFRLMYCVSGQYNCANKYCTCTSCWWTCNKLMQIPLTSTVDEFLGRSLIACWYMIACLAARTCCHLFVLCLFINLRQTCADLISTDRPPTLQKCSFHMCLPRDAAMLVLCYRGLGSRNYLRPSIYPSYACITTKQKKILPLFYTILKAITLLFWQQQRLVRNVPFHPNFALKITHPFEKRRVLPMSAYNVLTLRTSERVQLSRMGSRPRAFQWAIEKVRTLPPSPKDRLKFK